MNARRVLSIPMGLLLGVTCLICSAQAQTFQDRLQESKQSDEGKSIRPWEMKDNPTLKGATGRIVVTVPTKASMILHVLKAGEENPHKHIAAWYNSNTANFLPGKCDIKIWDAVVKDVPVERGKGTVIKVGVLHLNIDGTYEVYDENKSKKVFSGHAKEKNKIVLPVGKYNVKVKEVFGEVVIKDGQTTEF